MKILKFREIKESWGGEYEITEGEFKGYRLSTKTIVHRIYPLNKVDKDGLPLFKVSHRTIIRVLSPEGAE